MFLGIGALMVSASLLIAAVPGTPAETLPDPAPLAIDLDFDCPYAKLVIVSEPLQ